MRPVIHGYVQSAATVAANTVPLREELADIATLHYVDGPPTRYDRGGSRPWWILGSQLEHDASSGRWEETVRAPVSLSTAHRCMSTQVKWWSEELSKNQYDGVIGLSQGSAMTALLVSMVSFLSRPCIYWLPSHHPFAKINHPERVPGFSPQKSQPLKFAILCSGNAFW